MGVQAHCREKWHNRRKKIALKAAVAWCTQKDLHTVT